MVHLASAEQREMLAELLLELGDRDRALRLSDGSLELTEEILGRDHPSHAKRQALLAAVLRSRGDLDRAEVLATDAVRRLRSLREGLHPDLPPALATMASVRAARGNANGAIRLLDEALAIRERAQGDHHPDYIRGLNDLAEMLMARHDLARASAVLAKARRQAEDRRDVDPMTAARLLLNTARVLSGEGDRSGANGSHCRPWNARGPSLPQPAGLGERERLVLVADFRSPFFEALDLLKGDASFDRTRMHI